jgi:hypothetical protein
MKEEGRFSRSLSTALPVRFVIYIPSEPELADAGSCSSQLMKEVQSILCNRFGGVTSYPAVGLFKRASGVPQEERVQVLESFCAPEAWKANERFLVKMAEVIGAILKQESIACQVNGWMHLIGPGRDVAGGCLQADLESTIEALL